MDADNQETYETKRLKKIKGFLQFYDYLPIVRQVGDGCIVTMPHAKLIRKDQPRLIEAYAMERGSKPGIYCNSSNRQEETFVVVPEYALRIFLMCSIDYTCNYLPISPAIIKYVNEKGEEVENLTKLINPPNSESELTKEQFLATVFLEAKEDDFPDTYQEVAETHGVGPGYNLCKYFYKGTN